MKILLVTLIFVGAFTSACTKDAPPKKAEAGTVGKGLGGQTVGTSFGGSVGAGNSETRGSNVGQADPGQH